MMSTTYKREPRLVFETEPSERARRPRLGNEIRGSLLILALSLVALAWFVLFRNVRAGLPGEAPTPASDRGAVHERLDPGTPPAADMPR
jgi:hypothetical protein